MNIKLVRICFLFFLLLSTVDGRAQLKRFSFTENKMASPFTIILYSEDSLRAKSISTQCFELVDSLVNIYSDYKNNSELNRLCATAGTAIPFACSPALFEIIQLSKDAYEKSNGTFDITVGPLSRLWREAREQKKFPDSACVKEKLQQVGFGNVLIDSIHHTVSLLRKGIQLDLGGIAQGYIAQRVIDFIKTQKIENALVDVSGDIVCIGSPPSKSGWTVAINVPEKENVQLPRQLILSNRAVTTSGDVYQFMEHNEERFSHIINPMTGYGITSQRQVTVIAEDGTKADWLTKACSILPIAKAKKLALRLNAAVLIVESKNGKLAFHSSKNFKHFWKTSHNQ